MPAYGRSVAAGALAATLLLVLPTAEAAPARPVALAGTIVVTAKRSGTMRVVLPRPARVDFSEIKRLQSGGRFYGLVLRHETADAWVESIGIGNCARAGCKPLFPYSGMNCVCVRQPDGTMTIGEGTLPAGNYRLYVVADGAPVTMRMTLRGLSGSVTVTPTQPARVSILEPKPDVTVAAASAPVEPGAIFSAGSTHTVPSRGGHFVMVLWKLHPAPHVPTLAGQCVYDGPVSGSHPYQHPCSDGHGAKPFVTGNAATGQAGPTLLGQYVSSFTSSFEFLPADESTKFSIGAYGNTVGPAEDPHLQQLWIDY